MCKRKRERAIARAIANAHNVPDTHIVIVNRNFAADCTRARAHHSRQHGEPVRFLESRDASGRSLRSMPVVPRQPLLVHPVSPPI